jgi:hypothetical protein
LANLPDVLVDLLEVASYVYAADSAISHGGETDADMRKWWRRNFRFVILVREPDLWSSSAVVSALVVTLSFLSDEQYAFEFYPLVNPPPIDSYFEFPDTKNATLPPTRSFCFRVAWIRSPELSKNSQVLIEKSRSSVTGQPPRLPAHSGTFDDLRHQFGADKLLHIPVWARFLGKRSQESTHRTRFFLFAALGAVTAKLFGKERVLFYENGVVSLNLPPVAQVVGARAMRITHPQALTGFRRVRSEVFGHPFQVENPFCWLTKTEVVERIVADGCGYLIRHTRSCTRIHEVTRQQSHCGQCSQCLDAVSRFWPPGREPKIRRRLTKSIFSPASTRRNRIERWRSLLSGPPVSSGK